MVQKPGLKIRISQDGEMPIRILDVAQQQIQAAKQRHGIEVGIGKRLQPVAGLLEELRLAPREPRCGERQNREETGIGCAPLKPAAEQIDLLLNGEEAADLMEERFEILLVEAAGLITISIGGLETTSGHNQLIQQRQPPLMGVLIAEITAEQIQNPEGSQPLQGVFQLALLVGELAHPLLQLNAVDQKLGRRLIAPLVLFLHGSIAAGQGSQERQVRFTATAEGRGLRRLEALPCQLKGLESAIGLPEQHQARHLTAGGEVQAHRAVGMGFTEAQQGCFVLGPVGGIGQQISGAAQQIGPLEQNLVGEALIRRTVTAGFQAAQNRLWLCRWTDAQKSEMIDGQIQQRRCEETRILVSVRGFAHRSSVGP